MDTCFVHCKTKIIRPTDNVYVHKSLFNLISEDSPSKSIRKGKMTIEDYKTIVLKFHKCVSHEA